MRQSLGDFVLTWPLAMALSRLHPQSRIIYVTHKQKGELAGRLLGVESVDIENGWHHLFSDYTRLPEPGRRLLASSHSIYSFIANGNDEWSRQAVLASGEADLCCLRPTPETTFSAHATDYVLEQLAARPVLAEAMRQMIASVRNRGVGRIAGGNVAVIHPGSGSPAKCWPVDSYLTLARRLAGRGSPVRVILGEVELERWGGAWADRFAQVCQVACPATYLQLLDSLADARLYVGNDSGPSHLAGVIGLPAFVLFGPTSPNTWQPLGPRVRVMQRMPMETIPVHQVEEWLST